MKRSTLARRSHLRSARKPIARKAAKRWRPSSADAAWERRERLAVLERDGHRCALCGSAGDWRGLQVDHIETLGRRVPGGRWNREHPLNARSNKQTLCATHHQQKTEGRAA